MEFPLDLKSAFCGYKMYMVTPNHSNPKIGMLDSKDSLEDGVWMLSGQCLDGLWNFNSTFWFRGGIKTNFGSKFCLEL